MSSTDLDWLFRLFAPQMTLDVQPEAFTLRTKDHSATIATYIYVRKAEKGYIVASVGEPPNVLNDALRIDLFTADPFDANIPDKRHSLDAYCRYLLSEVNQGKRFMRRPEITVRGAQSLAPFVAGYERFILQEALVHAGAITVKFA